jgi:hypothetical protein
MSPPPATVSWPHPRDADASWYSAGGCFAAGSAWIAAVGDVGSDFDLGGGSGLVAVSSRDVCITGDRGGEFGRACSRKITAWT